MEDKFKKYLTETYTAIDLYPEDSSFGKEKRIVGYKVVECCATCDNASFTRTGGSCVSHDLFLHLDLQGADYDTVNIRKYGICKFYVKGRESNYPD